MGILYHDDIVADFGGNDGYAANEFYLAHAIKPIVIDCEPGRLRFARLIYNLPVLRCFIDEAVPLADNSICWGFCSHTIEHMRDQRRALREMARVIHRGCFFALPLEKAQHAKDNLSHAFNATTVKQWKTLLAENGWRVIRALKVAKTETQIYAEPR